jgi:hypothetical protein
MLSCMGYTSTWNSYIWLVKINTIFQLVKILLWVPVMAVFLHSRSSVLCARACVRACVCGRSFVVFCATCFTNWVQMFSHNGIKFYQILQQCKKSFLDWDHWPVTDDDLKEANSVEQESELLQWYIQEFLSTFTCLAICCWRWSSSRPRLPNPHFNSFHAWNVERSARLFSWFWIWGFSLCQVLNPLSLLNLLLCSGYFWLNNVKQN